jgi:ribosomal protein S18 acetylase RimI-like enzyme
MVIDDIVIDAASSEQHLEGILALQVLNHSKSLSQPELLSNGYVTLEHRIEQLEAMMASSRQIIALQDDKIVGYALSLLHEHRNMFPILRTMFDRIDGLQASGKIGTYYVMGQVCIHSAYRGRGIFEAMYAEHKKAFSLQYDYCITEVSVHNIPSMKAHRKVGFLPLLTFEDKQDTWSIIAWDWS